MKQRRLLLTLGLATACLLPALHAGASGSYTARPPQPGAYGAPDRARYELGQRIFDGKLAPEAAADVDAAAQSERLARLEARLPQEVAASKNLKALAGKLTAEQLEALEYFVDERYPN